MKNSNKLNKGARTYLKSTVKAASHPVRNKILKVLKGGAMSTPDLEEALNESRYNLYHHLDVLVNSNLITEKKHNSKAKHYELTTENKPGASVFIFTEDEVANLKKNIAENKEADLIKTMNLVDEKQNIIATFKKTLYVADKRFYKEKQKKRKTKN